MNRAAQRLGRMAKGVKKTLSPEEIARRTAQLTRIRARRWPSKPIRCSKCGAVKPSKGAWCPNYRRHRR
jgi:hypothetical protein